MVTKITIESEFDNCLNNNDIVICYYTAVYCAPCKMMSPLFDDLSDIYTNIVFIKLDVDQVESVANKQNISSMPTFKVYNKGKEIDFVIGSDKIKLKEMCKKISVLV